MTTSAHMPHAVPRLAGATEIDTRRRGTRPALDLVLVLSLIGGTILLHLSVPGVVPSGPDGGNWLAMAKDRFSGLDVMAAEVTYPPVLPFLLSLLLVIVKPVAAIVTMALLAKIALVVAVYVCARPMSRLYAAAAAVLVGAGGAQLEAYAWGAYPQLLGTAFGLAALYALVRFLATKRMAHILLGSAFALCTYATHSLVGGLFVFAAPTAAVHQLWMLRASRKEWIRGMGSAIALAIPGALLALNNFLINPSPGVEPVLNPLALDRWFSLRQTISDAPLPWIAVLVFGIWGLLHRSWEDGRSATAAVGLAWTLVGIAFFAMVGEARALLLSQLGLVLLALLQFQRLMDGVGNRRDAGRQRRVDRMARGALVVLGVATFSGVLVGGVDSYMSSTSWYRVVDNEELHALDILTAVAGPGDLVVAAQGHHGNQIGWWVQGYAGIPTYTGVDLRFLTFPDERDQAEIANRFFSQDLTDDESMEFLETAGADFLVVDRRGPDSPWLDSNIARRFDVIHDSQNIVIFGVAPATE
jgi:hypothetical protein